ncbi:hypothetical protein CK203_020381 [Vitis vinifera]|uniref:Uncharacterized protein n=1 Tax=Vitis vinifera TaxID=29760 RepID=A0A438IIW1_VITVI|nr:hypothetical protein CK203_020381 [Vitis vinifera]
MIVCVAVVGHQNNPLYIQSFTRPMMPSSFTTSSTAPWTSLTSELNYRFLDLDDLVSGEI